MYLGILHYRILDQLRSYVYPRKDECICHIIGKYHQWQCTYSHHMNQQHIAFHHLYFLYKLGSPDMYHPPATFIRVCKY